MIDCTHVYVAEIPNAKLGKLYPNERQAEIELVTNERLKREKYFVWRLLEYALKDKYGKNISELEFTKNNGGWWSTPFCEFSLSHTDGAVAVAVSDKPVGVDLEIVKARKSDKTAKRIMSADEYAEYVSLTSDEREVFFLEVWTRKEAVFKSLHKESFLPTHDYSDANVLTKTERIIIEDVSAVISVASQFDDVKFFFVNL